MAEKTVEGEVYLDTDGACNVLETSRARFYVNAKPYLRVHRFEAKKTPWYSRAEVEALAAGRPIRKASIPITGMFNNWTEYARSLGFNIQTISREVVVERLPQTLSETFHVTEDRTFVRRSEMSWVDRQPICCWSSWYPVDLVAPILSEIQQGSAHDVVGYIADHGNIIREVTDCYSSRVTTFEEQALFQLLNAEPLLVLQRMAKTEDNRVIMLYQDMQLLGSWFVVRRTEDVHYWDK